MWWIKSVPKTAEILEPARQTPVGALSDLQGMSAVTTMQALTLLDSLMQYDGHGKAIVPGTEKMGKRIDILAVDEWRAKQLAKVKKE